MIVMMGADADDLNAKRAPCQRLLRVWLPLTLGLGFGEPFTVAFFWGTPLTPCPPIFGLEAAIAITLSESDGAGTTWYTVKNRIPLTRPTDLMSPCLLRMIYQLSSA
jgi:hypothetical protein